jgi:hypothetical protein
MYLVILENYIVSLATQAVDRPNKVKKISIIVGELMDVMIQQEMLCPGMIFDGDEIAKEIHRRALLLDKKKESQMIKRMTWIFATAVVGLACFLFGFFTAP